LNTKMVSPEYLLTLISFSCISLMSLLGLNIILGYTGQPWLGHAAFFGVGAYTSAILTKVYGLSFWAAFPLSMCMASLIGLSVGFICLRLKEDFLAIATIALNFVIQGIISLTPQLGGALGIGGVPPPQILNYSITYSHYSVLALVICLLFLFVHIKLSHSWAGLAWKAIAGDDLVANVMGINVVRLRLVAVGIGCAYAGASGSLYVHFTGFIHPIDLGFDQSILMVAALVFGGCGTTAGPTLGAVFATFFPELFRFASEYRLLIYGILLVLLVKYLPQGVLGAGSGVRAYLQRVVKGK